MIFFINGYAAHDARSSGRNIVVNDALTNERGKWKRFGRKRALPGRFNKYRKRSPLPAVCDLRPTIGTVTIDPVIVAKRENIQLSSLVQSHHPLDGFMWHRRVVIDKNRFEVLREPQIFTSLKVRHQAFYDLVHA